MSRSPLELADIVDYAGDSFVQQSRRWITGQHKKVLAAINRCRTMALGYHRDRCRKCGHVAVSYNSCRNRHCPRCQATARRRWLAARESELLPAPYVHVVFTLPHELAPLALQNKRLIYSLLFRASAETLLEVAHDPRHLGAELGFFSVLHTWNQKLQHHPHVHCVVPAGGLAPDHSRWIAARDNYFLPEEVLSLVFRGKFVAGLKRAFHKGTLQFHGQLRALRNPEAFAAWLRPLFRQNWMVYAKKPFGGPEHVLRYLGAYTHRVAISNTRLIALEDGNVRFRWRDSADGNRKRIMTLAVHEFLRRFLLHSLPTGFVRIRHFGFLTNRRRSHMLPLCRRVLGAAPRPPASRVEAKQSLWTCPHCGGEMEIVERVSPTQLALRSPPTARHTAA
ncbi:MAG TPA: IS91 family transposase [Candidatus Acidoferrales bacterium]|nr:IS91 family transposase [Candidatus Acidoferrales bacterium]